MEIKIENKNGQRIAAVYSEQALFHDVSCALDFFIRLSLETGADRIAINKEAIAEDFFILSTGLAGEILQKLVNYQRKLAVWGDFSGYTSKPLRDFIYECNCGKDVFFLDSEENAVQKLRMA